MARKKTIQISALIDMVNERNRSIYGSREGRLARNYFLETILHETGNYEGFRYYSKDELPEGVLAGVIRNDENGERTFPDDSRVSYYHAL
jgi:hypothetical protein